MMTVNEVRKLTGVSIRTLQYYDTIGLLPPAEYTEYEEKTGNQSPEAQKQALRNFMLIFAEFGKMTDKKPEDSDVQLKVKELQDYITNHFYKCSNEVLKCLGEMYVSGGEFTENIDKAAGDGTAVFVAKAIDVYCK